LYVVSTFPPLHGPIGFPPFEIVLPVSTSDVDVNFSLVQICALHYIFVRRLSPFVSVGQYRILSLPSFSPLLLDGYYNLRVDGLVPRLGSSSLARLSMADEDMLSISFPLFLDQRLPSRQFFFQEVTPFLSVSLSLPISRSDFDCFPPGWFGFVHSSP